MIGYLDTPSGISGDMFLGCLVDAGWALEELREAVRALSWPTSFDHSSWSVEQREVSKGHLRATRVKVHASESGQPHRRLSEIRSLIEGNRLPETVVQDAIAVFTRLAEAEGAVHGVEPSVVHFHEVGALDSIIDIVGVCTGLYALGITELHAGPLPLGEGFIRTQHGRLPLPAPATLDLLARANAPVRAAPGPGELVTPTGAALVIHFADGRWQQPVMRLRKIAIGAGHLDFEWPNIARLWLGEQLEGLPVTPAAQALPPGEESEAYELESRSTAEPHYAVSVLIETNIDDMNPELYEAIAGVLFANGARDVWWAPIQMKKNRPGVKLSVLAPKAVEARIAQILLEETTTLGMRVFDVHSYVAERRFEQIDTPFGPIIVKLKVVDGEIIAAVPEFEACRRAATQHKVPIRRVYEAAAALAWEQFLQSSSFIG